MRACVVHGRLWGSWGTVGFMGDCRVWEPMGYIGDCGVHGGLWGTWRPVGYIGDCGVHGGL